jgi:hypothetical protein
MEKLRSYYRAILCFIVVIGLSLTGCGNSNQKAYEYDKGYDDAWDRKQPPSNWPSKEYKEGYANGREDIYLYDLGYDDAIDKKKVTYAENLFYMDGYKDGGKNLTKF